MLTLLSIREMNTNFDGEYFYLQDVEKRECFCTVGGNVIDTATMKDGMEILLKTRNKTIL